MCVLAASLSPRPPIASGPGLPILPAFVLSTPNIYQEPALCQVLETSKGSEAEAVYLGDR